MFEQSRRECSIGLRRDRAKRERAARARLIAAAPDLLAALDEVADGLAELGKLVQDGTFDAAEDWADANAVQLIERARAAIAKARRE